MKREIEALLFATDSPLTVARLKKIFPDTSATDLKGVLKELVDEYDAASHAFTVVEFGGGWQIATRPEYAPLVEGLFRTRRFTRLSRAGLEVLAIIAYRQPLTRLEVEEVRGVNSSGAITTLQERNLITVVGRSESVGHPLLYGTTREFLNHLGLPGLGQLPALPDLESIIEDRDELKAFASQFGTELTDEDFDELRDPGGEAPSAVDGGGVDGGTSPDEDETDQDETDQDETDQDETDDDVTEEDDAEDTRREE